MGQNSSRQIVGVTNVEGAVRAAENADERHLWDQGCHEQGGPDAVLAAIAEAQTVACPASAGPLSGGVVARGQNRTVTPPVIWICQAYCDFDVT